MHNDDDYYDRCCCEQDQDYLLMLVLMVPFPWPFWCAYSLSMLVYVTIEMFLMEASSKWWTIDWKCLGVIGSWVLQHEKWQLITNRRINSLSIGHFRKNLREKNRCGSGGSVGGMPASWEGGTRQEGSSQTKSRPVVLLQEQRRGIKSQPWKLKRKKQRKEIDTSSYARICDCESAWRCVMKVGTWLWRWWEGRGEV